MLGQWEDRPIHPATHMWDLAYYFEDCWINALEKKPNVLNLKNFF